MAAAMTWDDERLFTDGDAWFSGLLADFAAAKRSIEVEIYILNDDATGRELVAALTAAARRGVTVRMLIDGFGSSGFVWNGVPALAREPLEVRVWHPMPMQVLSPSFRHGSRVLSWLRLLPRINRRDHRKVCLIDDTIAWVGSFNIGDFIRQSRSGAEYWREAGARVQGAGLPELCAAFNWAWLRSWRFIPHRRIPPMLRRRKEVPVTGLVRLNHGIRRRHSEQRRLLKRLKGAKTRIWIAAAYFVPGRRLVKALERAAGHGVEVRLLMSRKSDVVFMPWIAAAFSLALIKRGVAVYAFTPGILHAKALLIDNWLSLGSTNLNMRSLLHDLEADVILSQPATLSRFVAMFEQGLAQARRVSAADLATQSWAQRTAARMALWFRYWL